jgi:Transposase
MEVLYKRCCGLDVHKESVTACVWVAGGGGRKQREIREWGTMTGDLLELADWLRGLGVRQVAMEATGVYWKPIWNILEGEVEVVLVNGSSGILCVNGRPLGEGMKAPAILHGLRDIDQTSICRDLTSGDFHGVGTTLKFLVQSLHGIRRAQHRPVGRVELKEDE